MQSIESVLTHRISRLNLDPSKSYTKVRKVNGHLIEEPLGRFVRAYRMGSGDGMTAHWEFVKEGKTVIVGDELWGSVQGDELVGFKETYSD